MTADRQDRKAHHLITPCPIPAPPFFLPVAHVIIHSAPVSYDQASAICAIASKRLETPSWASCRNSPVLMRMLPPHTSVSTRRAFRRRRLVKADLGRRAGTWFMPVGRNHRRRLPVDEQYGHLVPVPVSRRDNRANQRDSHVRHVLGGRGQVQFNVRHRGSSPLRWLPML